MVRYHNLYSGIEANKASLKPAIKKIAQLALFVAPLMLTRGAFAADEATTSIAINNSRKAYKIAKA